MAKETKGKKSPTKKTPTKKTPTKKTPTKKTPTKKTPTKKTVRKRAVNDKKKRPASKKGKKIIKGDKKNFDFYQKMSRDIEKWLKKKAGKNHKWAGYIMLTPNLFHLLIKLVIDPNVPLEEKAKLGMVIAYFIAPIDLIPEGIVGPIGYVDDIALTCLALNSLINNTDSRLVKKHWAGEQDILKIIKDVLKYADEMIGSGLWSKVKKFLPGK
jgi:uncharacterized membrane protein YkvA (DUF1232 family)